MANTDPTPQHPFSKTHITDASSCCRDIAILLLAYRVTPEKVNTVHTNLTKLTTYSNGYTVL